MKTTFSRMFAMFAALTLLCLLLLGISSRVMLTSFLEREKRTGLHNNAVTLSNLASAYEATGDLKYRWGDFRISLTTAAQVAGADILLCDLRGHVLMCGCSEIGCGHGDDRVDQRLVDQVVADGETFQVGTVDGIYEEEHFLECVAVTSQLSGRVFAILVIAAPAAQISGMLIQTTTIFFYVSILVLVGIIRSFTNSDYGIVNLLIKKLGGEPYNWMQKASLFRGLYVGSGIWQNLGWDSIIYIAALAGIDPGLHEAAMIDGANRVQRVWHINLPGIMPTMVILLILNSGRIMNVGFEKVYLMQNDLNLSVSDVISTYSYRIGIESAQYSLSTAISLFKFACSILYCSCETAFHVAK